MTAVQTLAAILWALTITAGIIILRKALAEARTPSPCERDAQDGRGETGEIQTNHNGSIY